MDLYKTELIDKVVLPNDLVLDEHQLCDAELLLNGSYAPLKGFNKLSDYISVLHNCCLSDKYLWTMPICLPIAQSLCKQVDRNESIGQIIYLRNSTNLIIAKLQVSSIYIPDLAELINIVTGDTTDYEKLTHPYAKYIAKCHRNCYYIGGEFIEDSNIHHYTFSNYRLTPKIARKIIDDRGWKYVVGFQTRNPMHKSHYYLTLKAVEEVRKKVDDEVHLMLTPSVGPSQSGDIDPITRIKCYIAILDEYKEEPLLSLVNYSMRMCGPREVLLHAQIRKNLGCTHFIVGRDHAGPSTNNHLGKKFYGPYDAHLVMMKYAKRIGIDAVLAKNLVFDYNKEVYVTEDEIQDGNETKNISGTFFRSMLEKNIEIPAWYAFPSVVSCLKCFYKPKKKRGLCIYFTGLPCSGKSTLACALEGFLLAKTDEYRKITMLDADVIRTHLSAGLGFSKKDRSINVRRIGYVAKEIVKHGGICIVANIAPYKEDRDYNENIITMTGGYYVCVYVNTPLSICEQRDSKQLYRKAKEGLIKQMTGVDDPYEEPDNASIVINSSSNINETAYVVYNYLEKNEYI